MHYTLIFFTAIDVMSGKPVESTATHPKTSIVAEQGPKSGTLTFSVKSSLSIPNILDIHVHVFMILESVKECFMLPLSIDTFRLQDDDIPIGFHSRVS